MRWLMLMICVTELLGCASQGITVRCDGRLQPINAPSVVKQTAVPPSSTVPQGD